MKEITIQDFLETLNKNFNGHSIFTIDSADDYVVVGFSKIYFGNGIFIICDKFVMNDYDKFNECVIELFNAGERIGRFFINNDTSYFLKINSAARTLSFVEEGVFND